MPKMKTNSSAKKRFKISGTGKIRRRKAGFQHLARPKSTRRKLRLRHTTEVSKADSKRIKKLLCK